MEKDWEVLHLEFMDEMEFMDYDMDYIRESIEYFLEKYGFTLIKKYQNPYEVLGYIKVGDITTEWHGGYRTDPEYDDYEENIVATWKIGNSKFTISEFKLGYSKAYKVYGYN